jgi:hypothetical protein
LRRITGIADIERRDPRAQFVSTRARYRTGGQGASALPDISDINLL